MSTTDIRTMHSLPPPMKKTQQYYSFRENLWNHTCFTCAKVAKFYQKPLAKYYETHPTEDQLREMQENERLEQRDQRAQVSRLLDSNRLHRRKFERTIVLPTQLQSRSKQVLTTLSQPVSLHSSIDSTVVRTLKPAPVSQVEISAWADIDFLPVQQIKKFLPRKELMLDDSRTYVGATAQLLAKRAQFEADQAAQAQKQQELRDQHRAELARRHQATADLERKCGIFKYRANPLASTMSSLSSGGRFGLTKSNTTSPRSQALSQARDPYQPHDPLLYAEFRGLIQAQHRNAVRRMRTELSRTTSISQLSAPSLVLGSQQTRVS